ncbi:hypothetical protein [Nostoc sphaeroides]|uniref:Uncharacterized protein n=1 Tax=Nostoc sphaeroides CCNUC1 TaxID=2653204 RepID=A0A5P8WFL0_9NOSO|nr:hypothetical protein [Nostoc sphaeroides]QFS51351.1 hypothetical protein GXM_08845 [Nostoc sphaeroides CCNUC1]
MERAFFEAGKALAELRDRRLKDNPELRGKGGCWAIVSQVNEFSCTVKTWDGDSDRISRVYLSSLEESVQRFLEMLGKLNRAYLTDLEEKVLNLLELEIIP